ncbi:hypothetical protein [Actinomadura macrotermitis]|uniref:MarR family transcriptional regulator n=1 Tax=Actinomadura macrotermitis TaxID=2585200 RepID=A0A7K0C9S6_9ACTN|nr:hypothetical protein [Actinomadura macrotermitis]MQY09524.1 hypothetical protein [Actinomadura macrotermitis]
MDDKRADVQALSPFQLLVYETVAELDKSGTAADIATLQDLIDSPEEDLWAALSTLVSANHLHSTPQGYVLGPHDWSA